MEDPEHKGRCVSAQYLGALLRDHRPLRLAVLNACEGARASRCDPLAGTAQSLVQQGIPAVIAMQFEVSDESAICFTHEFYAAIAGGYPVDAALSEARKAIFAGVSEVEWGTPVLYMRCPDARIFDVQQLSDEARQQSLLLALVTDAESALASGLFDKAETKLRQVLAVVPEHAKAQQLLGQLRTRQQTCRDYHSAKAHYAAGRFQDAIQALKAVLSVEPEDADAKALAAQCEDAMRLAEAKRTPADAEHNLAVISTAVGSSNSMRVSARSAHLLTFGQHTWRFGARVISAVAVGVLALCAVKPGQQRIQERSTSAAPHSPHQVSPAEPPQGRPAPIAEQKTLVTASAKSPDASQFSTPLATAEQARLETPSSALPSDATIPVGADVGARSPPLVPAPIAPQPPTMRPVTDAALTGLLQTAVLRADRAEILAFRKGDVAVLTTAYAGKALRERQQHVRELERAAEFQASELHAWNFESFSISADEHTAEVRTTETWSTSIWSRSTMLCVKHADEHDVRQTIRLKRIEGNWLVSAISFRADGANFGACH